MKRSLPTLIAALAGLLCCLASIPAQASYPDKPLRLIVPFPAGGASDVAARTVGQALAKALGQPVLVENRPGASGAIAAQAVMSAPPDGLTLLWASASMVSLPFVQRTPPYQSLNDLTAVSMVGRLTYCLFVPASLPAKSVAELVAQARAKPDALSYATGSLGEMMTAAQFLKATGTRMVQVPYKGGAQAMPDLVAGRVQVNFGPFAGGQPFVRDGKLRMLAVLGDRRHPGAAAVPTLAEAGIGGVGSPTWQAIFAPPGTARAIVDRLAQEIGKLAADGMLGDQLAKQAVVVETSTPAQLAEIVKSDARTWQQFVREYGIPKE
ncbi:MAG TPA: tripartite tricarboxylate transporter substrate binding protein [Usitatibacteraceae bacterium]|nr:tripartite tricarboxylate transporter substrate binding protein [Usitatibacteraceae bacterium]